MKFSVQTFQLLLAFLATTALLQQLAHAEDRLIILGGQATSGNVQSIDERGQIQFEDGTQKFSLAELRSLERPVKVVRSQDARVTVHLLGGGSIVASAIEMDIEKCTVQWAYSDRLELPLELVRGVQFVIPGGKNSRARDESFIKALDQPTAETDQLFVLDNDQVQVITGLVEGIADRQVSFNWQDATRQISVDRVYGLIIAITSDPPDRTGQAQVALTDGTRVWGHIARLADDQLTLRPTQSLELSVPWSAVSEIRVINDRLVFLSDLQPTSAQHQAIVTFSTTHQLDMNVAGGPLSLRNQKFDNGIGVSSRSELVFPSAGFDLFAATIGIDDDTHSRGDCEFVVLVDGAEKFRQRVRGIDPPYEVKVDVAGSSQVTLLVEPGKQLDLADHANWCDARFIKESSAPTAPEASQVAP